MSTFTDYYQIVPQIVCTKWHAQEYVWVPSLSYFLIFVLVADVTAKRYLIIFSLCISLITCENMLLFIYLLELWGSSSVYGCLLNKRNKEFSSCFNFCNGLNNYLLCEGFEIYSSNFLGMAHSVGRNSLGSL